MPEHQDRDKRGERDIEQRGAVSDIIGAVAGGAASGAVSSYVQGRLAKPKPGDPPPKKD